MHIASVTIYGKKDHAFSFTISSAIFVQVNPGDPESLLVVLVLSAVMRLHPWGPGVPGGPQGEKKERLRPPGAVP